MAIRPPAVAGSFYPAVSARLSADVDRLLSQVAAGAEKRVPKALIVPHAGYVYSGSVAAHGYAQLKRESLRQIVLFGPAHFVPLRGIALPAADGFETPLGTVPIDAGLVDQLAKVQGIGRNAAAHAREHSLEVQLPFLQRVLQDFRIVPLVVGRASTQEVALIMDATWGDSSTVIVVSSDLSHYMPYEDAAQVDRRTADQILALGPVLNDEQACGARAINGLLVAAAKHRLHPKLLDIRNSGDTAGSRDEVVGYASFAFYE
jgi:AmmeMemoRadiSam system protein B